MHNLQQNTRLCSHWIMWPDNRYPNTVSSESYIVLFTVQRTQKQ